MEADHELARIATENLRRAGVSNVTVREADGSHGLPAEAPFDVILLSGSVAEAPQALLDQLKVGGRLLAVVGGEPAMRATLFTRSGEREFRSTVLFETVMPRLAGFEAPSRFVF
jgi:protein-L-isoaspartate(D-aspartate) O-methyltransferase